MPANINLNPEVALGFKQADPMTSLGNMINVAGAMQNFKQAQQLNPLEVEKAQEVVSQAKTKTQSDQLNFAKDRLAKIADSQISMINNPLVVDAEQNPNAVNTQQLVDLVKKRGFEQAEALGIPKDQASQLMAPYVEMAEKNPSGLRNYYKERHIAGLDQAAKTNAISPTNVTVGDVKASQDPLTGEVRPLQFKGNQQQPTFDMTAPPPSKQYGVELQYPVRKPNQPYQPNPSEPIDLKYGQEYRQSLAAANDPRVLSKMKRDLEEVDTKVDQIAQKAIDLGWINSRSGFWGAMTQKFKQLIGDPDYQELSKNLANLQISQLQASGGSLQTDAGKALIEHANGTATYNPEVLKNIIGRVTADVTNREMQNQAAEKYAKRFGDQNMKLFQKQWNENADDGKVFQAIYLYNTKGESPETRQQVIDLLGKPGTSKLKENLQKFENINDLTKYGYISERK